MKTIILFCFTLICSATFAQQHATSATKCQLPVEEILKAQSFEIDEPIAEKAKYVFFDMYKQLNFIYQLDANDPKRAEHINYFNIALQNANVLDLNISMFQEDIDFVTNLTP
ncbi:hypothetical protein [Brumimicrobium mesophilum]|uniref:hypothetical protein n=1 Tax=Brumimicrobium mesophilum TaxID=392717 RepID=UPI000D1417E2|nr:hypothetical protein [Brumimicrobium mesophilum]